MGSVFVLRLRNASLSTSGRLKKLQPSRSRPSASTLPFESLTHLKERNRRVQEWSRNEIPASPTRVPWKRSERLDTPTNQHSKKKLKGPRVGRSAGRRAPASLALTWPWQAWASRKGGIARLSSINESRNCDNERRNRR